MHFAHGNIENALESPDCNPEKQANNLELGATEEQVERRGDGFVKLVKLTSSFRHQIQFFNCSDIYMNKGVI